ncbi:hypothetical protein SAMN04489712_101708 [Thermomonospora echinospora]|uniref:Uncharacterized protein n=1 Tax=Thermomonospora echinospora TaxID=1992 RepID=A0A1H5TQB3_9ACTN|nr:hypothetical protein SAMN04489712_101708 [Thermomonospora echinospora]
MSSSMFRSPSTPIRNDSGNPKLPVRKEGKDA